MTLNELPVGQSGRILKVGGSGALRQHFLDMGLIPDAVVTLVKLAPLGDPMELRVHDYELTLRMADARQIEVETVSSPHRRKNITNHRDVAHPGLGQDGIYHTKADRKPLALGETLTFGLVGNQNCGKTTLFNQLTGANQHVGNFPGVTVDRKDGSIRDLPGTLVTDLPGIYSLSPYSSEEMVTRQFVLQEKPRGIINIVDATNMERNLYLTMQVMELNIPMVLAVNMMDEMRENGGTVKLNEMEQMLGIPVVPISALKNEGIQELIDHAVHVASNQERPGRQDFCSPEDHGGAVHRCLHGLMHLIEDHAERAGIPPRFAASKLAEGDKDTLQQLHLDENEQRTVEHIIQQMEQERGLDRAAAIADMRYHFIDEVCARVLVKPAESKGHIRSQRIDRLLTGKFTAIPAFILIMALIFWLTFGPVGSWLTGLLELAIGAVTSLADGLLSHYGLNPVVHSLIIESSLESL